MPLTATFTQPPLLPSHSTVVHFLQQMDLHRHIVITQSPYFTGRFTLDVVHSVGFDNCIMAGIHHYSVIQNSFTGLKILCILTIHPSLPLSP